MQPQIKNFSALSLLLLLGFIWGTGYSIARFATLNGVPPLGYSFWQSLGPALLLGLLCLFQKKSHCELNTSSLRYYLICAITGIVIPNTNMYFAAPHLPAGLLAVIVNTVPIVAYPLALWAQTESFSLLRFFGVLSAVCGLMLIVLPPTHMALPQINFWALSALITPLSFAFCAVYIARFRPAQSDSLGLAAGTLIVSSLILLPIVLFSKSFYFLHWPLTSADLVILLEIILSSVGYILLFKLIHRAGPVFYSLVDTIVALTGLFWGYVIFQEKLTYWTLPAVFLILLGLVLVTVFSIRDKTPHAQLYK